MLALSGRTPAAISYAPLPHRRTMNLAAVSLLILALAARVTNGHDHGEDELEEGEVISAEPIVSSHHNSYYSYEEDRSRGIREPDGMRADVSFYGNRIPYYGSILERWYWLSGLYSPREWCWGYAHLSISRNQPHRLDRTD
jgi:hypothetical protein